MAGQISGPASRAVFLIAARRTVVAPKDGDLRSVAPHEMAVTAVEACLRDARLSPDCIDEIVLSNCLGMGGNPARLAALQAGLPTHVAGLTVDRQCCGGLDALLTAAALIRSGQADFVLAGGTESASLRPNCFAAIPTGGYEDQPFNQAPFTPWPERDPDMHEAAARLARNLRISKEEQDAWAVTSHHKARLSQGRMAGEIATVPGTGAERDGFTRQLTMETCRRAKRVSDAITVANMAVAADGAAMCLLVSERVAYSWPRIQLMAGATMGGDPEMPGTAPVAAIETVMRRCNLHPDKLAVAEIMEAYAAQAIACVNLASLPHDSVNPGGGSLARGHPVGASGAILAVRLFHEIRARPNGWGLAAIAAAGGLGTAMLLRNRG